MQIKQLILVFFLFASLRGFSQIEFELKAGPSISFISGAGIIANSIKPGFHIGAGVSSPFNKWTGLAAQLVYSQKGGKYKPSVGDFTTNLNYLTIPVLLFAKPREKIKILFGIEPAFLLSAYVRENGDANDVNEYYETFDFGLVIGTEYYFNQIGFGFQYVRGLTDLTELTITDPLGGNERREKVGNNNVFQASFIYKIRKRGESRQSLVDSH